MLRIYKSDPLKSPKGRDISLYSVTLNCVYISVHMYFWNTHKHMWRKRNGLTVPTSFAYTYFPSAHSLIYFIASLPVSLPTVLRDRIWIHKPVSAKVSHTATFPGLPSLLHQVAAKSETWVLWGWKMETSGRDVGAAVSQDSGRGEEARGLQEISRRRGLKDREKDTKHHSPFPIKSSLLSPQVFGPMTTFNSHFVGKINEESSLILSIESLKWSLEHKVLFKGPLSSTGTGRRMLRASQNTSRLKTLRVHHFS